MSKTNYKICVVVPNYNRGTLLKRCLESLEKQSFDNYVVVIVDSSDNIDVIDYIGSLLDFSTFVLIKTNEKNVSKQRNIGIMYALNSNNFTHITFVDSDDMVIPSYLKDLIFFSKTYKTPIISTRLLFAISFVNTNINVHNCSGNVFNNEEAIKAFLGGKMSIGAPGKLIDIGVFRKVMFNERLFFNEDKDFVFSMIKYGFSLTDINYYGYLYYQEGESLTRAHRIQNKMIINVIEVDYSILEWVSTHYSYDIINISEQLFADNFLSFYPRINFKRLTRNQKNIIQVILDSKLTKKAILDYKPYSKNSKIRKNIYRINKKLFVFLFKIYIKINNPRLGAGS